MDVSRLDQWEIVFEHADRLGMFIHFKTLETENELLLDGGDLGPQRKLYYRELIARFGHHLALNWNLGEEINNASTAQKKAWAQYFYDHDPYHHLIVIHNGAESLRSDGERLEDDRLLVADQQDRLCQRAFAGEDLPGKVGRGGQALGRGLRRAGRRQPCVASGRRCRPTRKRTAERTASGER